MTPDGASLRGLPYISIAIFAWNEERAIESTLQSLFEQSVFDHLRQRQLQGEVICVANGCTDGTVAVAKEFVGGVMLQHPDREVLRCWVADIPARGKINAWNQFVHQISARSARFLFMMDADILIHGRDSLWNMLQTLEQDAEAAIAVDIPRKHIAFKQKPSFTDRLSLSASQMTLSAEAQLCGQLYCIRAQTARRLYMPKELSACEDGLIKALVCTDFLEHAPWARRIRVAPGAEHTFEAYTSPAAILKNQKRQVIGQTMVHLLVDRYLPSLPAEERQDLPGAIKARDSADPGWLKRLVAEHLRSTRCFWRLHPGLLGNRFRHLRRLGPLHQVRCLPAALGSASAGLLASLLAYRSLKRGCTDYWPKAQRVGLGQPTHPAPPAGLNVPASST